MRSVNPPLLYAFDVRCHFRVWCGRMQGHYTRIPHPAHHNGKLECLFQHATHLTSKPKSTTRHRNGASPHKHRFPKVYTKFPRRQHEEALGPLPAWARNEPCMRDVDVPACNTSRLCLGSPRLFPHMLFLPLAHRTSSSCCGHLHHRPTPLPRAATATWRRRHMCRHRRNRMRHPSLPPTAYTASTQQPTTKTRPAVPSWMWCDSFPLPSRACGGIVRAFFFPAPVDVWIPPKEERG
ncbi:hypothetical protein BS50DRAFT_215944 [Corynespora cassiicola Philippines]|uniref:Uncharacterized protein n=1 Tax=Corynespora cassiicola Philippines TaxID=1448308 RepID=A0A2T2N3L9_CORCC|nr:hypothetical protein BS50DRAFT_215944 [Corynespora cassiicola Philippines]